MSLDWRKGIAYITTAGMEACWLFAIATLLNTKVAGGSLSMVVLFLLYAASFVLNRLLGKLRWRVIWLRSVNLLAWAVSMLLMVKIQLWGGVAWSDSAWLLAIPRAIPELIHTFQPELLVLLGSGAVWWLGQRLARIKLDFAASVTEFQFGLLVLVIMFFSASQFTPERSGSLPLALVFFLFAMLGISIAHAREGSSWLSGLQRRQWWGLLLTAIGAVVLIGLLISWAVTPGFLQTILDGIKWLWEQFVKLLQFLASLLPSPEPSELPPALPGPGTMPSEEEGIWTLPETIQSVLRVVFNVIMIGLAIFVLWRISSQIIGWFRRRSASEGAEVESLRGAFRADLVAFLRRFLAKLFGLRFPQKKDSRAVLPEIASVRQIYRQLLKWAASRGYPRGTSQTPLEYLRVLADALPQARQDLEFVTSRYVSVRYSPALPTEDEVEQLRQSWNRIRQNHFQSRGA